ncbi:hypothetical protein HU200_014973 [Digitaria exilis]|uniref:BHLH domain-containing protein n=1 Tax=Digitaria exilis TaxID=1010633 RepID=A0A835FBT4_9POAL|nr:hypothetical protein HU200_014973 [Digitaria exilis]
MRKLPAGGSSRRSSQHGDAAHNLTEKRRRHKINEKLRTLQQLVPGCDDKSNQASTLDQTIQYLKSLQHHIQAMSVVPSPVAPAIAMPMPPAAPMVLAPAAPAPPPVAPVAMPMPAAAPAMVMVVPLGGAMLQLPHYLLQPWH